MNTTNDAKQMDVKQTPWTSLQRAISSCAADMNLFLCAELAGTEGLDSILSLRVLENVSFKSLERTG